MRVGRLLMAAVLACAAPAIAAAHRAAPTGYPRYTSSSRLQRLSTSATIRDDFNGKALDLTRWRVWTSDPGRVRMRQEQGRFWIDVTGKAGYNGLVSRIEMPTRDVELVCRAGIASQPQARHAALIHLCGSGPLSPDHWFEVQLRDAGGNGAATVNLAVPLEQRTGYRGGYDLRGAPESGYLFRIVCEASNRICRGFALDAATGEWWQLGDGFEVPARTTRLEIKATGFAEPGASSRVWFDDCRVYPRPQTHYLTVVLRRSDGGPPGARAVDGGDGRRICLDADNAPVADCDLEVRLFDAEGRRLIGTAHTGTGYGYAMLGLDPGWDVYPVGAVIRVYANGHQIGPDHPIRSSGVDGLYPDDVYAITLD